MSPSANFFFSFRAIGDGHRGWEGELTRVNDRFCWIFIFDGETGKVVKIREYINTALVREVAGGLVGE